MADSSLERQPYESELNYFRANPDVGGMASEDNRVVINPFSTLQPHELDAVRKNETARIHMRKYGAPTFLLTQQQRKSLANTPYSSASHADMASTIAARLLSNDPSGGSPTLEQINYVEGLRRSMGN